MAIYCVKWRIEMDLRHKVQALLDSDISGYQVQKLTGFDAAKFSRLRKGTNSIDDLTVKSAEKLGQFYDGSILDLVAQGDESFRDIKGVLGDEFQEILDSQFDLANSDEGSVEDIRTYNVLFYLLNRVLHDNDLLVEVAPYFKKTEF